MVDDNAAANLDATASRKRKVSEQRSKCGREKLENDGKHTLMKVKERSKRTNNSKMFGNEGNNCGTESVVTLKGRKLKQYVLEEKLDIIDYAKIIGNRAAGREFNVAESSIREWRKNEQRLRSMFQTTPERSQLDGSGRRPVSEDLEKNLLQYVTSRSDNETALTWHDIKEKANALWKDICDQNPEYCDRGFTANMGWVARFVRRNNITLQVTNSASKITPKLVISNGNSNSNIIDTMINRTDCNSISCSISSDMMANSSSCMLPSSTVSLISDNVVNTNIYCCNDAAKMNTITTTTTKATVTTTATTTLATSTMAASPITVPTTATMTTTTAIATIATADSINNTVSAKKRRKNFTPKKVIPNDVICLAANNRTNDNTITTNTATTSVIASPTTTIQE